MMRLLFSALFLVLLSLAEAQPNKPHKVKCQDKNFPDCYHKDLYCPDSCPKKCEVDCQSCQPVCAAQSQPPVPSNSPPPPPVATPSPPPPPVATPTSPPPPEATPSPPPPPVATPSPPPPPVATPTPAPPPPEATPSPPPPPVATPSPPPPPVATPSPPPPPVATPSPPPPPVATSTSPPPPLSPPPPPEATPSPPPPPVATPSPPPPGSSEAAGGKRVRCKSKLYPSCYYREHRCPAACPNQCEVDCVTCSPVCDCNKPGAVCQDPRFIGADGITFYFHGKKDKDFCIVSDTNLHINAHFIGRRNENMGRDFTWVQSLGILFHNHQIFVGAKKTATWDNTVDRLELSFDGLPVYLSEGEGAKWQPNSAPGITITRSRDTNSVMIEVAGNFKIKATVVPITAEDSRIHKYGVTDEDCFAHLDLGFKFYSLSGEVNGVLGQTYASNYVSRVKMGIDMPVLGGRREFASSGLFSTDCTVARFKGTQLSSSNDFQYANLKCASGLDGRGVVCRR